MQFAYTGFSQEANVRCFHFQIVLPRARPGRSVNGAEFTLKVDMSLFVKYRVPVQEGPALCLRVLTEALANASEESAASASYAVTLEHFSSFALARAQVEEARLARRKPRTPFKRLAPAQAKRPQTT